MASLPHGEEPGDGQDIRLVVDTIPTLACPLVQTARRVFNQRWLDYTGLSAEQALGSGWQVAIHPDDLPRILETFREALNSVKPYEVEAASAASTANFAGFFFVQARCAMNSAKLSNGMAQIPILKTANVLRTLSVTRTESSPASRYHSWAHCHDDTDRRNRTTKPPSIGIFRQDFGGTCQLADQRRDSPG